MEASPFPRKDHELFVSTLLRRVPRQLESFHSQRLLLLYFAAAGADILGLVHDAETVADVEKELRQCFDFQSGGFCPVPVGEFYTAPTLTMTHCALRVLETVGRLEQALSTWLPAPRVASFVKACAVPVGSSSALAGGFASLPGSAEVDVRFTYSALMVLRGLKMTPAEAGLRESDLLSFVLGSFCRFYGGFGSRPGATEAHGGMTFCAVASLSLLGQLQAPLLADLRRRLRRYCAMRIGTSFCDGHADTVGIQGRPNKPCDTCYTHWVGCTAALLGQPLDEEAVESTVRFVLSCQDPKGRGGIAKEADMPPDPMHTCLALSGLAVLAPERLGLCPVAADTGAAARSHQM